MKSKFLLKFVNGKATASKEEQIHKRHYQAEDEFYHYI